MGSRTSSHADLPSIDEAQAHEIFTQYDKANKGYLSKEEVDTYLHDYCKNHKGSNLDKMKKAFWKEFDPNHTGKIEKSALKYQEKPAVKHEEKNAVKNEEKTSSYPVAVKPKHKAVVDSVIAAHTVSTPHPAHVAEFNAWFLNPKNLADIGRGYIHYMFRRWIKERGEFILWRMKPLDDDVVAIISNPNEAARILDENIDRSNNLTSILREMFGPNLFVYDDAKEVADARAGHPITLAGHEWVNSLEEFIAAETRTWIENLKSHSGIFDLQESCCGFIYQLMSKVLFGSYPTGQSEQFYRVLELMEANMNSPTCSDALRAESTTFTNNNRAALAARVATKSHTVQIGAVTFKDLCGRMLELGHNPTHGLMLNEFMGFFNPSCVTTGVTLCALVFHAAKDTEGWRYGREDPPSRCVHIVKEAMRIAAPVPVLQRNAAPKSQSLGHTFDRKTVVYLCPFAQHLQRSNFGPDAAVHRPSRWSTPSNINQTAFIPYGSGRRNCVGYAVADVVLQVITRTLLSSDIKFSFHGLGEPRYKTKSISGLTLPAEKYSLRATSLSAVEPTLGQSISANMTHLSQLLSFGHLKAEAQQTAADLWADIEKSAAAEMLDLKVGFFEAVDSDTDPRLDYWTKAVKNAIDKSQHGWQTPVVSSFVIPTTQERLPKERLYGTQIDIPLVDEDWPMPPRTEVLVGRFLRTCCPDIDDFKHDWMPGEDKAMYVRRVLGHMWARTNVYWNDHTSDDALERFAFLGLGQHHLKKLDAPKWEDTYYGIELEMMSQLQVREGFGKYGASAYFSKEGKITRIVREGTVYLPNNTREWEFVKMVFRSSLLTYVTVVEHLVGIHATVSNFMTTASREQLPPNHPIRRLLKPFTYRSAYMNYLAGINLFTPHGLAHRAFALSLDGLVQTFQHAWENLEYEPFPQRVKRHGVEANIPLNEDGLELWQIDASFVSKYVDLYYPSEEALRADKDLNAFWTELNRLNPPKAKVGSLSFATLKDYLTYSIFMASAGHNHIGTVGEYVMDPGFCPTAYIEGELASRPLYAVRAGLILCVTGFSQPSLLEDISGLMLDDNAKALCHEFRAALEKQVATVDQRNIHRRQPFQSFNPRFIELGISV